MVRSDYSKFSEFKEGASRLPDKVDLKLSRLNPIGFSLDEVSASIKALSSVYASLVELDERLSVLDDPCSVHFNNIDPFEMDVKKSFLAKSIQELNTLEILLKSQQQSRFPF